MDPAGICRDTSDWDHIQAIESILHNVPPESLSPSLIVGRDQLHLALGRVLSWRRQALGKRDL